MKTIKFVLFFVLLGILIPAAKASQIDLVNALYDAAYSNQAIAAEFKAAGNIPASFYFQGQADAFTQAAYSLTNSPNNPAYFDFADSSSVNQAESIDFAAYSNGSLYFQGRAAAFQAGLFMQAYYLPLNP